MPLIRSNRRKLISTLRPAAEKKLCFESLRWNGFVCFISYKTRHIVRRRSAVLCRYTTTRTAKHCKNKKIRLISFFSILWPIVYDYKNVMLRGGHLNWKEVVFLNNIILWVLNSFLGICIVLQLCTTSCSCIIIITFSYRLLQFFFLINHYKRYNIIKT